MGDITVGISKKTEEAMRNSGVMPVGKPTGSAAAAARDYNALIAKKNATQKDFTNEDIDNMSSSQFVKYLNLPEGKAKGGKVAKKKKMMGGPVKKYARGGGIRKARSYG